MESESHVVTIGREAVQACVVVDRLDLQQLERAELLGGESHLALRDMSNAE